MRLKKLKPWHIALITVFAFLVTGLLTNAILTYRAHLQVEAALRRLHRMGMPNTDAEIEPPITDSENAATLYMKAAQLLPRKGFQFTGAGASAIEAYDRTMEPAMQIVIEAAESRRCYFPEDWSHGWRKTFPEFDAFRAFGNLCRYRAIKATDNGDWRSALKWDRIGLRIAEHACQPSLVGMVISLGREQDVLRELGKQIRRFGKDEEFRVEVKKLIRGLRPMPSIHRALRGASMDLVHSFDLLANPRSIDDLGFGVTTRVRLIARFKFLREQALAQTLNLVADVVDDTASRPSDWKQCKIAFEKMERATAADHSLKGELVLLASPYPKMWQMMEMVEKERSTLRAAISKFP